MKVTHSLALLFLTVMITQARGAEISFTTAQEMVRSHSAIKGGEHEAQSMRENARVAGAWGDPMFMIGANNLPIDKQLKRDVTPMSGIVFGLSQKIPLGPSLKRKEQAFLACASILELGSEYLEHSLVAKLWINLIELRRKQSDLKFLQENERWLGSMVKVSKKLYSNGKVSQQALLDIQIRNNQVRSSVAEIEAKLVELKAMQEYLIGENSQVRQSSIPWDKLRKIHSGSDLKEDSLKQQVLAAELERSAARWKRLPEVTLALNYIKRENIDRNGDYVGFSVSFPIPFGTSRPSSEASANQQWLASSSKLRTHEVERKSALASLEANMNSLKEQTKLARESLIFARTAREVSSKSYRIGGVSYYDLLQSELRLQEMEFRVNELVAKVDQNFLEQKLWHSDVLVK